jgi:5,5'-dehydrodivanillate O-demethylase oxygenase subunit
MANPMGGNALGTMLDDIAMIGQGAIVDRTRERLGRSDVGIARLRRLFFRALEALQEGRPMKSWTPRRDAAPHIPAKA